MVHRDKTLMVKTKPGKSIATKRARRREELKKTLGKPPFDYRSIFQRPEILNSSLVLVAFALVASVLLNWSRLQPRVSPGQIMVDTRLKRLDYTVEDIEATEKAREEARKSSPRVYRKNQAALDRLQAALEGLPTALAGVESPSEISDEIMSEFQITSEALTAIQVFAGENGPIETWRGWVIKLVQNKLYYNPLLDSKEFQNFTTTLHRSLRLDTGELKDILGNAIELKGVEAVTQDPRLAEIVAEAGFPEPIIPIIIARLKPTILFDPALTDEMAENAARLEKEVFVEHHLGDIIYQRGDVLNARQFNDLLIEIENFKKPQDETSVFTAWLPAIGLTGLVTLLTLFTTLITAMSYPRITRNTMRVAALCILMFGALAVSVVVTAQTPGLLYLFSLGPVLIVTIVILLAYDARLAVFLGGIQCAITTLALGQSAGWFILLLISCGIMTAQLREFRHRNSLIRAATITAGFCGAGAMALGLYETPAVVGMWGQVLMGGFLSLVATIGVGFLMLGVLPIFEKIFDITTGMTLAELRDTKQPLLRQLQQKAPGTYNHSLQVGAIAEAAADAIGADSLLVYVGALYHDIGKMNKPEYFVENQTAGYNKHERLSPTMSLLVIVGHVKDGIELAKEYGLPRRIQHFIEAHHGTTLVEYFYHVARTQAEDEDKSTVEEIEFRYPGPKPRTKEAAILMLSDCVESASRTMSEPNPARIEGLVRMLSRKRLMDGQFDHCDLTFRDLNKIEDAIISRMCAIHHGRISYPTAKSTEESESSGKKSVKEKVDKPRVVTKTA